MNRDLHDIDELFRSALEEYKDTPSPEVKESLDAVLDKQDAEKYKKRFIIWKRTALLLLLLLTGFVLYESGIIKKRDGNYAVKTSASGKDDNNPANSRNDNTTSDKTVAQKNNTEDQPSRQSDTPEPVNSFVADRITGQKISRQNRPFFPFTHQSTSPSQPDRKMIVASVGDSNWLLLQQRIEALDQRTSVCNTEQSFVKKISLLQPVTPRNAPLTADRANDIKKIKLRSFNPFWMVTAFGSYDQAGYKLDSDEPTAVKGIKFREAHEPSFSAGLLMTRQLTSRIGLQSGVIYSSSAIGMKPQKTYAFTDPTGDVAYKYITSSGYAFFKPNFGPQPAVGDSLTTAEAKHTIKNITIPLAVKYRVSHKKISFTPGAGIEANFITKANLEVDIEDPFNREIVVVRKLNGTKPFYWSFVADAEVKYDLTKKLSLSIRPVYRHAISPITKNNVVETFPHSFSIGAGLTIKF